MAKRFPPLIAALTIAAGFLGAACVYQARSEEQAPLRARAERLFSYEHSHANALPAHKLRALSVALAFHDDQGAQQLLSELESSI